MTTKQDVEAFLQDLKVKIKISMGILNQKAVCISFHLAEHSMNYPYKK